MRFLGQSHEYRVVFLEGDLYAAVQVRILHELEA